MKTLRWRSLTVQVVLAVFLPLTLGAVALTIYSQDLHHRAMQEMVGERNLRTVQVLADGLDREIRDRSSSLDTAPAGAVSPAYSTFDTVVELDPSGGVEILFQTSPGARAHMVDAIRQAEPKQTGSDARFTRMEDGSEWLILEATRPDGTRVAGVLEARAFFTSLLVDPIDPGQVSLQVYDAAHEPIFEGGRIAVVSHSIYHEGILDGFEGKNGVIYPVAEHGHGSSAHVIAYAPVESAGWVLVMDEAWEDVSSENLDATQNAPLIMIPFLLLASAALFLVIRQVVVPLQKLELQTARLGEGDYTATSEPVGGIQEVRALQDTLGIMAARLDTARQSLQSYIGAITRGVEEERLRLSRDLHDGPLQLLIALKHRLQTGTQGNAQDEHMAQEVIDNLRGTIRGLRPVILEELGLTTALEQLCVEVSNNLPASFKLSGEERRLPADVELAFFRIAQEALANALRHAEAGNVGVALTFGSRDVSMTIHDDGRGFNVSGRLDELINSGHYGLAGMHERAVIIGAEISIDSQAGKGTTVSMFYTDLHSA